MWSRFNTKQYNVLETSSFLFDFYYSLVSLLPLGVETVNELPTVILVSTGSKSKTQTKKVNFLLGLVTLEKIYSL